MGEMGLGSVMKKKPCGMVLEKFIQMSEKFDRIKHSLERKYFPCLRYVAIRLLDIYGADFQYYIPIVKTPCKVEPLAEIFNILCDPYCRNIVLLIYKGSENACCFFTNYFDKGGITRDVYEK